MRKLVFFTLLIILSCNTEKKEASKSLKTGTWRATIEIQGQDLPFNLDVVNDKEGGYDIYVLNADERLLLDEVTIEGDSIKIGLHIFDADIRATLKGDTIQGEFIKNYEKDYNIPFLAVYGQTYRFPKGPEQAVLPDFSGKYEVVFENETDTTEAIGIFKQHGDSVTGTFLTSTGDYRYLQGIVVGDRMQLSTFDGNHAYIFTATKLKNGELAGEYYSGKNWMQFWRGVKNENAKLPDAESLTYLKEGYDRIEFTFPDVDGKKVSLNDDKYKNKVVILQLFGTWCPNCMDETQFLNPWYNENKHRGIEIIGLAYERKDDFNYASSRVKKMIDKYNITYDFVIAGTNDKKKAGETLPMLNRVAAFPTTIFIGKDGKVKKIHTGFSGPGTGLYYDQFIQHFNETINELLSENIALK
ncbi:peroxiredoxin family protein [Chryseosolibacter indicus]|uniref:TlpA family protein disulfide reductase n=1 Tax=Chryseosolibacter indicus TaxID=2782351 RepID=A0ABS5VS25_9BACT|nr:TlpA disulfide reductase family protein [Chryseosolibacter indicus]MBT1704151.1 TlpA family protein disulfide reductase [Chryseosolibacter indicus]